MVGLLLKRSIKIR